MATDKILLIYPGKKERAPYMPLPLLNLGTVLRNAGYDPKIVDTRIQDLKHLDGEYLLAGITSMTGPQISHGLAVAGMIREEDPNIPIVWGGPHATMLPEQTAASSLVDIAVSGDGEETIIELANTVRDEGPLKDVNGIAFKKDGVVVSTPPRGFTDMNAIGSLHYDLVDLRKYIDCREYFSYQSSRGCPHNCTFCFNHCYSKGGWRAKKPEVVVEELRNIIEEVGANSITFQEDNSFVDKERMRSICSAIIREGWDVKWMAYNRADYFSGYDDEFTRLLGDSGCETLFFGAESGSQRILDGIGKGITVSQITDSVRKCGDYGITPMVSFIIGWPDETPGDLSKTLSLVDELRRLNPRTEVCNLWMLIPQPGTPIHETAVSQGMMVHGSLEEWGGWRFDSVRLPWMSMEAQSQLDTISNIVRFTHFHERLASRGPEVKKAWLGGSSLMVAAYDVFHYLFNISAEARWRRRYFNHPVEWRLWGAARRLYLDKV
ncbi:MAG: radical SAM protein [Candidatus Altiarchaeota archaeon]